MKKKMFVPLAVFEGAIFEYLKITDEAAKEQIRKDLSESLDDRHGFETSFDIHLYRVDISEERREFTFFFSDNKHVYYRLKEFGENSETRKKLEKLISLIKEAQFYTSERFLNFTLEGNSLLVNLKPVEDNKYYEIHKLMRDG